MRALLWYLAAMMAMIVAVYVVGSIAAPIMRSTDLGRSPWPMVVAGAFLLVSPILGLLCFELASGRAFDKGFLIVRRVEFPRTYWGLLIFHACIILALAAATCVWLLRKT